MDYEPQVQDGNPSERRERTESPEYPNLAEEDYHKVNTLMTALQELFQSPRQNGEAMVASLPTVGPKPLCFQGDGQFLRPGIRPMGNDIWNHWTKSLENFRILTTGTQVPDMKSRYRHLSLLRHTFEYMRLRKGMMFTEDTFRALISCYPIDGIDTEWINQLDPGKVDVESLKKSNSKPYESRGLVYAEERYGNILTCLEVLTRRYTEDGLEITSQRKVIKDIIDSMEDLRKHIRSGGTDDSDSTSLQGISAKPLGLKFRFWIDSLKQASSIGTKILTRVRSDSSLNAETASRFLGMAEAVARPISLSDRDNFLVCCGLKNIERANWSDTIDTTSSSLTPSETYSWDKNQGSGGLAAQPEAAELVAAPEHRILQWISVKFPESLASSSDGYFPLKLRQPSQGPRPRAILPGGREFHTGVLARSATYAGMLNMETVHNTQQQLKKMIVRLRQAGMLSFEDDVGRCIQGPPEIPRGIRHHWLYDHADSVLSQTIVLNKDLNYLGQTITLMKNCQKLLEDYAAFIAPGMYVSLQSMYEIKAFITYAAIRANDWQRMLSKQKRGGIINNPMIAAPFILLHFTNYGSDKLENNIKKSTTTSEERIRIALAFQSKLESIATTKIRVAYRNRTTVVNLFKEIETNLRSADQSLITEDSAVVIFKDLVKARLLLRFAMIRAFNFCRHYLQNPDDLSSRHVSKAFPYKFNCIVDDIGRLLEYNEEAFTSSCFNHWSIVKEQTWKDEAENELIQGAYGYEVGFEEKGDWDDGEDNTEEMDFEYHTGDYDDGGYEE